MNRYEILIAASDLIILLFFFAYILKIRQTNHFKKAVILGFSISTILNCLFGYLVAKSFGAVIALIPTIITLAGLLPFQFKYKRDVFLSIFFFGHTFVLIGLINSTENFVSLSFENQEYLWLILLLPVGILIWRFSVTVITSWQNAASLILRMILLMLIIIAISGPRLVRKQDKLTVIFLVDRSESMPRELAYDWYINYIKEKISQGDKKADDLHGIVVFSGQPGVYMFPDKGSRVRGVEPEAIQREITDIGSAIRQALALFPEDSRKRLVIISDGNSNKGDLFRDLSLAIHQNVVVDVVTYEKVKQVLDARIERLVMPVNALKDEPFEMRLVINSTVAAKAKVRILRNGKEIDGLPEFEMMLKAGNNYPLLPLQILRWGEHKREQGGCGVQGGAGQGLATGEPSALGDDNSAKPAGEGLGVTELRELAIGGEEGVLGGILGEMEIAEDRVGAAVGHVLKTQDDLTEG